MFKFKIDTGGQNGSIPSVTAIGIFDHVLCSDSRIMYHQEAFVVGWTAFAGASPVAITTVITTMSIVTVGGNLPPLLH